MVIDPRCLFCKVASCPGSGGADVICGNALEMCFTPVKRILDLVTIANTFLDEIHFACSDLARNPLTIARNSLLHKLIWRRYHLLSLNLVSYEASLHLIWHGEMRFPYDVAINTLTLKFSGVSWALTYHLAAKKSTSHLL